MTVLELSNALGLKVISEGENMSREISGGVYCCDLLSIAMGRAPSDGAWVTVMANVNAVAVAVLCDIAVLVIAEGMAIDEATKNKADMQGVTMLFTEQPVFEVAKNIDRCVGNEA